MVTIPKAAIYDREKGKINCVVIKVEFYHLIEFLGSESFSKDPRVKLQDETEIWKVNDITRSWASDTMTLFLEKWIPPDIDPTTFFNNRFEGLDD